MWYSETFIFLLVGTLLGALMAILGAVGCFILALLNRDEAVGEVKVGKILNIKGVSLILMSLCGVALMGYCVQAWVKTHRPEAATATEDMLDELGYFDDWDEWNGVWEDDDSEFVGEGADDDVTEEAAPEPSARVDTVRDIRPAPAELPEPYYAEAEELGPPGNVEEDDPAMDLLMMLEDMEYVDEFEDDEGYEDIDHE